MAEWRNFAAGMSIKPWVMRYIITSLASVLLSCRDSRPRQEIICLVQFVVLLSPWTTLAALHCTVSSLQCAGARPFSFRQEDF